MKLRRWAKANRTGLSVLLPEGEPPTEIRLFKRGENPTSKGVYKLDDAALQSVMSDAEKHGVDIMLDLEHLSLEQDAPNYDPDARGWGKLEARGGDLYLTQIKWTPDGERRLRERTQRYVSPTFDFDPKTKRVLSIFNVAITALPATDSAQPLVAASDRSGQMDPKELRRLLGLADDATDEEVMAALGAKLARLAEFEKPPADEEKKEKAETEEIVKAARLTTGKTKSVEVVAVLTALSASRSTLTDLTAEVATLRAGNLRVELRELCRSNPKKIASEKLEGLVMKCSSIEAATALIEALPEVVAPALRQKEKEATDEVTLSDEERNYCKLTGESPVSLLEYKKKQAALAAV